MSRRNRGSQELRGHWIRPVILSPCRPDLEALEFLKDENPESGLMTPGLSSMVTDDLKGKFYSPTLTFKLGTGYIE